MKINTNSNGYILGYASVLVIVVAFLLAFLYKVLEPMSNANVENDKKKQILASLNIRNFDDATVEEKYNEYIVSDPIIDSKANIVKDSTAFGMKSKEINDENLPLYVCKVDNETKYVIPLNGKGLWGPIWGYLAINSDKKTVYGVYFNHESETAGLGARIVEDEFQNQFKGKKISEGDSFVTVVKKGNVSNQELECDGISGATKTSVFVGDMLRETLLKYVAFLNK